MSDTEMLQPIVAIEVVREGGEVEAVRTQLLEVMKSNYENARAQAERVKNARVIIYVADCPDVRVDFPSTFEAQELLCQALGYNSGEVAVVSMGVFGAGADPATMRSMEAQMRALNSDHQAIFWQMPHFGHKEGENRVVACGAQKGKAVVHQLPEPLRAPVDACIHDTTVEGNAQSYFAAWADQDADIVVSPYAHTARQFDSELVLASEGTLATRLQQFLSNPSPELDRLAALLGKPTEVDVRSQDTPFVVVELGGALLAHGGAGVLLNQDRAIWGDPFVITSPDSANLDAARQALAASIYPDLAAGHGHDFASVRALVIMVDSDEAQEMARQFVSGTLNPTETALQHAYPNVFIIDSREVVTIIK